MKGKKWISVLAVILALSAVACSPAKEQPERETGNAADVIMFMGQSNMAGRGDASEVAVAVPEGHGYEFRAVSDPMGLHSITEPFGVDENRGAMSENKKTGSLVSAFCEGYYRTTGVPVVAVSASQGGTKTAEWQAGGGLIEEARQRLEDCLTFMDSQNELFVRHVYMVWLQGESDAANMNVSGYESVSSPITPEQYKQNTTNVIRSMQEVGVEHAFMITIGNYSLVDATTETQEYADKKNAQYNYMDAIQKEYCAENADCTLVSIKLEDVPLTEEYMHLKNHHQQKSYDIVGWDAGLNTASYVLTGNAPQCTPFALTDYESFFGKQ